MLQIVWNDEARNDLGSILHYIAERNPSAAKGLKRLIEAAVMPAVEHPYLYRPGRVSGTREIVAHPNYVVVYQVGDDTIEIMRVLHARQQYP